jgi:signal transduction histidine kinase
MTRKGKLFDTLERVFELSSTANNVRESFPLITEILQETFPCNDCQILTRCPESNTLIPLSTGSGAGTGQELTLPGDGHVVRHLCDKQQLLFVRDVSHLPFKPSTAETPFLNAAPMTIIPIAENGLLHGVLYLRNQGRSPFSRDETRTLSLICEIIAHFLGTTRDPGLVPRGKVGWEGESPSGVGGEEGRELLFFDEASTALLASTDLDRVLHTVLTAITLGEGLGFNRAMLLLFDRKDRVLRGTMAIGPDSPTEAQRIWASLSKETRQRLSDRIEKLERRSEISEFNEWVRQICIPIGASPCLFERTLREGRSFLFRTRCESEHHGSPFCLVDGHPTHSPACDIHRRVIPQDAPYDTASAPLWGRGGVIGIIAVDNIFSRKPIMEEDLRLLEVFAKQAGLAIEHAITLQDMGQFTRDLKKSQDVLVQSETMAALRQMAADVAHAIRNPLVSIGGFARRLDRAFDSKDSAKKYTETLIKETSRLESILDGIHDYAMELKSTPRIHSFNQIVGDALNHISETRGMNQILVGQDLEPNLPTICGDDQQIKQAIVNILSNAIEAMNGQGRLSVKTYRLEREGRNWVAAEIMDSGGGMKQEVLHNIFNPFFTTGTKEAGLGLAICHRIIASHEGVIDVDNRPGLGVRFIIRLPQDRQPKPVR